MKSKWLLVYLLTYTSPTNKIFKYLYI